MLFIPAVFVVYTDFSAVSSSPDKFVWFPSPTARKRKRLLWRAGEPVPPQNQNPKYFSVLAANGGDRAKRGISGAGTAGETFLLTLTFLFLFIFVFIFILR